MANEFDFAQDLRVEIRKPTEGSFVLNVSKLNGPDVLRGTATVSWQEIQAEVSNINLSRSVSYEGAYYSPTTGTGTLTVRSTDNNPDTNALIYVGLPIRVRYRPAPDTTPLYWNTLFYGSLANTSVRYQPGQKPAIQYEVTDNLDKFLNTLIDADYAAHSVEARVTAINASLSAAGITKFRLDPEFTNTTVMLAKVGSFTVSELVNDVLQMVNGWATWEYLEAFNRQDLRLFPPGYYDQDSYQYTLTTDTPTTEYEHSFSEITSTYDSDYINNQITVTDASGTVLSSLTNSGSIALHGIHSINTELQTANTTFIAEWAAGVIADTRNQIYEGIELDALTPLGNLASVVQELTSITSTTPFPIRIYINKDGYTADTVHPITRLNQTITPEYWTITLDVGRGKPSAT